MKPYKYMIILLFVVASFMFTIKTVLLFFAFFALGFLYAAIFQEEKKLKNQYFEINNHLSYNDFYIAHKKNPSFRSEDIY